jgi:hypothetical protein
MRRLILLLLALAPTAAHAAAPPITEAELLRRTQQMFDSLVPGDQAPWKLYLADDVVYSNEKGRTMDKAAALADVTPMPSGYTGAITLAAVKFIQQPNVAILNYDILETETIYGQLLHARYHETDTWLLRNDQWQIAAAQVMRYYEDPAAAPIDPAHLNDYLGAYQITPGQTILITRTGDKLFASRNGAAPTELLAEAPDLFFRPGVEGRRLFRRNARGQVDALIDRRNNEDLLWKKIS